MVFRLFLTATEDDSAFLCASSVLSGPKFETGVGREVVAGEGDSCRAGPMGGSLERLVR